MVIIGYLNRWLPLNALSDLLAMPRLSGGLGEGLGALGRDLDEASYGFLGPSRARRGRYDRRWVITDHRQLRGPANPHHADSACGGARLARLT
jgi:hypothetical protein